MVSKAQLRLIEQSEKKRREWMQKVPKIPKKKPPKVYTP